MSDSLRPHEPQHARPPCPSPTPRVHPNSCPSSWWCHPTISSSVVPFSSCPQSFPASGSFFLWSRAILIQQVSPGGWGTIEFESPSPLQSGFYLAMINFICQLDWATEGPRQILFWVCLCWCVWIRLPVCLPFGTSVFCLWNWTQMGAHIIIPPGSQGSGLRRELHHHRRLSCITSLMTAGLGLQPSS